jgi:hypothetical protein
MKHIGESVAGEVWFETDGRPRIRRFRWRSLDYYVTAVGRAWVDDDGRHVLVMDRDERIYELVLTRSDLHWHLERASEPRVIA